MLREPGFGEGCILILFAHYRRLTTTGRIMTPAWEIVVSTEGWACCSLAQNIWFLSINPHYYPISNINCFSLFGKPWLNDTPFWLLSQVWLPWIIGSFVLTGCRCFFGKLPGRWESSCFLRWEKELPIDTVLTARARWQIISWPWNRFVAWFLFGVSKTEN